MKMKKIFIFLGMLLMFAAMQAQTTVLLNGGKALDLSKTKWYAYNYKSSVTDLLVPAVANVHDTTDYILQVTNQNSGPLHFYAVITLDKIVGTDTTVAIVVQQKKFASESYSDIIASALTSVVSAEQLNVKTTLGVTSEITGTTAGATDLFRGTKIANNDTLTVSARTLTVVANTLLYPRYIKFRLNLSGNDYVGTGVKVKRIEIQFYN